MIYFGKTDKGTVRKGNQDSFGIYRLAENALLCLVCDGMGGAAGGETASALAEAAFSETVKAVVLPRVTENVLNPAGLDIRLLLAEAAQAANERVLEAAEADPALRGMGTTLVALLRVDSTCYAINVGDSRMYCIDAGAVRQLTHDHSYVQFLIDMGKITPEEAKTNTNRNIITRAVGAEEELEADIGPLDLSQVTSPCYLLLCSDGLTNMVSDEQIAEIVRGDGTPEQKTDALIEQANRNGGADNITVILLAL